MHTMKEYEDIIMGYNGKPLCRESAVSNEIPTSTFLDSMCNCKSINYTDYVKKTKETVMKAMTRNEIRKTNTTNNHKILNTRDIYAVINGKAYAPEVIRMIRIDQAVPGCEFTITPNPMYAIENTMLSIRDVIFNPPATIVFWGDGSKTVVKCQDGEEFDPEKGLTMAFFKKMHGNKGHYFEEIKKWTEKYDEPKISVNIDWSRIATALMRTGVNPLSIEGFNQLLNDELVDIHHAGELTKVEDNTALKALVDDELMNTKTEKSVKWAVFYTPANRSEDEGYNRYPVVYTRKSSAVRAAKRLISKLPADVEYDWFVNSIDEEWI